MNLPEGWKSKETDLNFSEIKKSYEGFPTLGECNVEFKEAPEHSVFSKYILNDHIGDKINLSDEHKVHALNHIDGVITLAQEVAKDPSKQNCVRMHSALQGNHLLDGKLRKKMNSALKVIFGEDFDGDDSVNSLLKYAHSKKAKAQGASDSLGDAEFAIRLRPGKPKDADEWVTVEGRKVVRNPVTKRWVYEEKMEKIKKEQEEKRKKRNINPEDIQKLTDKFGKEEPKKKEITPIDGRPGFKKDRKEDNRSIEQVIKDTTSGFKSGPYNPEEASEMMRKERRKAMEWAEENLDSWDMDQYTERANNAMQMCEDIENLIKNDIVPGSQTQGIYKNGRLVGGLMTSGEDHSYVEVLFSSPANAFPGYPKATKGAGTQGILMAIQNTRKHGGDGSISLRSKSDALDFYKKLGFEPVGKYGKMVLSAEKAEALAKKHGVEFDENGDNQDLPIYAVSKRVRKYLRKKSSANFSIPQDVSGANLPPAKEGEIRKSNITGNSYKLNKGHWIKISGQEEISTGLEKISKGTELNEQVSQALGLEVSKFCGKGKIFLKDKCKKYSDIASLSKSNMISEEEVNQAILLKVELAKKYNEIINKGLIIDPGIKRELDQESKNITDFINQKINQRQQTISKLEEHLNVGREILNKNPEAKNKEGVPVRLIVSQIKKDIRNTKEKLKVDLDVIKYINGELKGEEAKNPYTIKSMSQEEKNRLRIKEIKESISRESNNNKNLENYLLAEIFSKEQLKNIKLEHIDNNYRDEEEICKRNNAGEFLDKCKDYLVSRRALMGYLEDLEVLQYVDPNRRISEVNTYPQLSGLGFLKDSPSFLFRDKNHFLSFVFNQITERKGDELINSDEIATEDKVVSLLEEKIEKLEKEIKKTTERKDKDRLSKKKTKYAEYLAVIQYLDQFAKDDDIQIFFPKKGNQSYFDFIAYDPSSREAIVVPVKYGKEQSSDPGREADSMALLGLIGKRPKRKENQTKEEYQSLVKTILEQELSDENSELNYLLKRSILGQVFIKNGKSQVIFKKIKRIKPNESIKGTRGPNEIMHKYRIEGGNEIESFSDSINNAIGLLSGSKDFSEKEFDMFMREQEWQAI